MTGTGKVAIVTGAGSGIGRATALALLRADYAVALAGRPEDALAETVAQAPASSRSLLVPTDVSHPDAVRALFEKTKTTFGRLDLLFNNAGVGAPAILLEDFSIEKWRQIVDVNLTGVPRLREAFRVMKSKRRGGRIINNGRLGTRAEFHRIRPRSTPSPASQSPRPRRT